jgi:tetratricopeptide (TPR) repeat protein
VQAFETALRFDSEQPEIHYQMAMALAKLDRLLERDKALKRFRELRDRTHSKAEEVRQAARLIEEAKPYVDRGELGHALELLRKANAAHPDSAEILFRIAGLEYDLRRLDAARATVLRAIELRSDEWNYYFLLGLVEKDASRLAESRNALETALRLNPQSADVHNQLGTIALAQGLKKDAIESFRTAVKLAPGDSAFRANLEAAEASGLK